MPRSRNYARALHSKTAAQTIPQDLWTDVVFNLAGADRGGWLAADGILVRRPPWAMRCKINCILAFDDELDKTGVRGLAFFSVTPAGGARARLTFRQPLVNAGGVGSNVARTSVELVSNWEAIGGDVLGVKIQAYQNSATPNLPIWPLHDLSNCQVEFEDREGKGA